MGRKSLDNSLPTTTLHQHRLTYVLNTSHRESLVFAQLSTVRLGDSISTGNVVAAENAGVGVDVASGFWRVNGAARKRHGGRRQY